MKIIPINTSPKISILESKIKGAGRGVFATQDIKKGEVIEVCPVMVVPRKDYPLLKQTILHNYYFMWGKSTCAVCLGFGSMYNHSYNPNATYIKRIKDNIIEFASIKNIKKNEEITVNYNYGKPESKKRLWIADIKTD
jgi:uncharacterized protein